MNLRAKTGNKVMLQDFLGFVIVMSTLLIMIRLTHVDAAALTAAGYLLGVLVWALAKSTPMPSSDCDPPLSPPL